MTLDLLKAQLRGSQFKKTIKAKKVSKYRMAKDLKISQRTFYYWQKGVEPSDELAKKVGIYLGLIKPDDATKMQLKMKLKELQKEIDRLG